MTKLLMYKYIYTYIYIFKQHAITSVLDFFVAKPAEAKQNSNTRISSKTPRPSSKTPNPKDLRTSHMVQSSTVFKSILAAIPAIGSNQT